MGTLMHKPVRLPGSGNVVDYAVIKVRALLCGGVYPMFALLLLSVHSCAAAALAE
jgi:hypothetical protein